MTVVEARGKRRGRTFAFIAMIVVLVLAVLFTAGWFVLARRVDRAVDDLVRRAAEAGISVACDGRDVFGYPLQMGVRCEALSVDAPNRDLRVAAAGASTAAQFYAPGHAFFELKAPVRLAGAGAPPMDFDWQSARASVEAWIDGLSRVSIVLDSPQVALARPAGDRSPVAQSDHLEFHAQARDEDLDIALADQALKFSAPNAATLPPLDLAVDVSVHGAADWLRRGGNGSGERPSLLGRTGEIRQARLAVVTDEDADLSVSGPFSVSDEGAISGDFRLAVGDPAKIANVIKAAAPQAADLADSIAATLQLAGSNDEGQRVLPITVRDGMASVGIIPLGRIPSLR
ncbi:DUF2125 domain-containing protein [Consotaella aegiceratis]|uniref:DUF2125 domain-containing protein n=1 Tax=Consotaella aegiceratis TaxID=3097961 RepID=UPI002F41F9AD